MRFDKLLLSEMRLIESKETQVKDNQGNLELAILDNENLHALGYTLKQESVFQLAKDYKANPNMEPLYKRVMGLEPAIEVDPMYPGFPQQVLEMDELEYRAHQAMHYMSTYGLENLFNIEVRTGWLPYDKNTFVEREEDVRVVDLKTLEYLTPADIDKVVIDRLIGRVQRLEPKELELAQLVVLRTNEVISEIPFKENIGKIYGDLLLASDLENTYKTFASLKNVVRHPGDVLDLVEYMVIANKYKHFKTSVKRGFVELICSFELPAIEENLASNRWSKAFKGKGGKARSINRNIALIDYLSFSRFATNQMDLDLISELKDGNLISWNQKLEQAYAEQNYDLVLRLLGQRPGVLFRQVNRLVKLGVDYKNIMKTLKDAAGELKTQSIVSALNNYVGVEEVNKVFLSTLVANLVSKDLDTFRDKKVYLDEKDVDFSRSKIEITDKFEGYISNGIAMRIPETAKFLRFFTYWNDKQRIDIDLHGMAVYEDGESSHIGWHGRYKDGSLVHSGDITHSDASEYIDMNLDSAREQKVEFVQFNINSYTQIPFKEIDTVFTGLMALSEMGAKVDLFDPKNVLFRHDLEYKAMAIDYGVVDIKNNVMYINGTPSQNYNDTNAVGKPTVKLSILTYVSLLILTQGGTIVSNKDEADLILGLAKSDEENYVSLLDENYFM